MKSVSCIATGVSTLALAAALSATAFAHPIFYPNKHRATAHYDSSRPLGHVGRLEGPYIARKHPGSGTWTDVGGKLPFVNGPWAPQQLTDGTVLVQDFCTSQWYKLTPDKKGQYTDGTWSAIAAMQASYEPLFFATQILPNGEMIVNGGEYIGADNMCSEPSWTNQGALYNPVSNSWTPVAPPQGFALIGDAESIVLPNGSYMLADCCDDPAQQAIATVTDGTIVTWTTSNSNTCPTGDFCNDEEGYSALPDGNVLIVDVWNFSANSDQYEIYNTAAGTWSVAGNTADRMSDSTNFELGSAALTPQYGSQGSIVQFSGVSVPPGSPVIDIYDVASNKWRSGPVLSYGGVQYTEADAPSATLPDGNVFMQASPGYGNTPSHFWELKFGSGGKLTATQVSDPAQAPNTADFESNMLVLPTGQVLWDNSQATPNEVAVYTPQGRAQAKWLPAISGVATRLARGSTGNAISGSNFNGFDLGGVYGDDAQAATNFPLVRITNGTTGDVCFARSYNFSTMGVWTTGKTNAVFDIPTSCEKGKSRLQVVVNGIASNPVAVTLN